MILIFCSGLIISAFSQTNTFPASGNMGIGTGPVYSFDVNSTGDFGGALTVGGKVNPNSGLDYKSIFVTVNWDKGDINIYEN